MHFTLEAFFDLDTERSHNFGLVPIPWSKIKEYGTYYELAYGHLEEFIYLIRRIDEAHLDFLRSKLPKSGSK